MQALARGGGGTDAVESLEVGREQHGAQDGVKAKGKERDEQGEASKARSSKVGWRRMGGLDMGAMPSRDTNTGPPAPAGPRRVPF